MSNIKQKKAPPFRKYINSEQQNLKIRRCLSCKKEFESSWIGERICIFCKRSSKFRTENKKQISPFLRSEGVL